MRWGASLAMLVAAALAGGMSVPGAVTRAAEQSASAPPAAATASPASHEQLDAAERWIALLGASKFDQREEASQALVKLGNAARAPLAAALKHPDAEIRSRARWALAGVRHRDLEARLASLAAADWQQTQHQLPGWQAFCDEFGSAAAVRETYLDMVQAEIDLFVELENQPSELLPAMSQRLQVLESLTSRAMPGVQPWTAPAGSVLALLFVGSQPEVEISAILDSQVLVLVTQAPFRQTLTAGPLSGLARKMLDRWLRESATVQMSQNWGWLAFQYKLEEGGLQMARRALHGPGNGNGAQNGPGMGGNLAYPILALGRFGSKADLPLLEPLLADQTVCFTFQINKQQLQVQLRDLALGVALHLSGQDPKDYGFDRVQRDERTLFSLTSLSFEDSTKRNAAFARWHDWQAAHGMAPAGP
jgi:hypothetical protein